MAKNSFWDYRGSWFCRSISQVAPHAKMCEAQGTVSRETVPCLLFIKMNGIQSSPGCQNHVRSSAGRHWPNNLSALRKTKAIQNLLMLYVCNKNFVHCNILHIPATPQTQGQFSQSIFFHRVTHTVLNAHLQKNIQTSDQNMLLISRKILRITWYSRVKKIKFIPYTNFFSLKIVTTQLDFVLQF